MPKKKKEDKKKKVKNINWKDIIVDAKVVKSVDVPWEGSDVRVYYKELVGDEGITIENKYPNDTTKVICEKTYMMLAKANVDVDDKNAKISRREWDNLPERLRSLIVMKIWQLEQLTQENFQKLLDRK